MKVQQRFEFVKSIGIDKSIPQRGYYVYAIIENGNICYIGKGSGNRVLKHFNNSSNQMLYCKMQENNSFFDWCILDEFEEEHDCLFYEEQLILDCKKNNHKLYNVIHYSKNKYEHSFIKRIFHVLKQYDQMLFIEPNSIGTLSIEKSVNIFFDLIKDVCSKLNEIPIYKSKPLNQLSFSKVIQNNKVKIIVN